MKKNNIDSLIRHEFIVLAPEHYNTLGLIRSLGEAGIRPVYIVIKSRYKIASYSKYIKKLYLVDSLEEGYELLLRRYGHYDSKSLPFLYTIDDKTQTFLDTRHNEIAHKFIYFNCGQANRTALFMDKYQILKAAKSCGIPVLDTCLVDRGVVPKDIEYPIITKASSPTSGGWKSDVHICNNEDELKEAFKIIKSDKVLIQRYVDKENECCLDGFAINHGKNIFIATESFYNYNLPGYYSPYMTTNNYTGNATELLAIQDLFKLIGFEGIFSVEYLIDKDGRWYFSEINFRHSTWSYIATKNKMNLPYYWAVSMLTHEIECNPCIMKEGYTAMVEPVDYQKRVVEKRATFFKWLYDLFHTNCTFYWNWRDLKPSLYMVFHNKLFR